MLLYRRSGQAIPEFDTPQEAYFEWCKYTIRFATVRAKGIDGTVVALPIASLADRIRHSRRDVSKFHADDQRPAVRLKMDCYRCRSSERRCTRKSLTSQSRYEGSASPLIPLLIVRCCICRSAVFCSRVLSTGWMNCARLTQNSIPSVT
jgi:hypothetical protein